MDFNKEFYEGIIDGLHDGLYIVGHDRIIIYWNKAAERISGFPAEEVVGRPCSQNILTHIDGEGNNLCKGNCPVSSVLSDGLDREDEVFLHHRDGHRIPVSIRVSPLRDGKGNITGAAELFTDLREKETYRLRIKELEKMAMVDSLTRLPNRRFIEMEIRNRIGEKKRFSTPFGILFMDIDHFKKFNDTYGHDVGDMVLKFVAKTLIGNRRPFDVCGRWGGEEFIGIIRNVEQEELERIGERFRMLVEGSYIMHEGTRLSVTISIGATLFRDSDNAKALLKRADSLLYESKAAGRNRLTAG